MNRVMISLLGMLACAAWTACSDDDPEPEPEHEDPAEHACEHASESGTEIEGGAERDDSAPELELGDEPYTVALSEDEARYVRIEVEEHAAVILFAGAEDVVTGLYHGDEEESLDSAGANDFCDEDIPEHFDVDLHEPGTYYLRLGPSALDDVWLLITEAEGHAH